MKKVFLFLLLFSIICFLLLAESSVKYYGDVTIVRDGKEYNIKNVRPKVSDRIITKDNSVVEIAAGRKYYYLGKNTIAKISEKGVILENGALYSTSERFKTIESFLSLDNSIKIYADPYPFYSGKLGLLFIASDEKLNIKEASILEKNYPIIKFYKVESEDENKYVYRTSFGTHVSWQFKSLPFKADIDIGNKIALSLSIPLQANFTPPPERPKKPAQMSGVNSTMTNILSDAKKSADERNMLQKNVYTKFLDTNFARGLYTIPTQGRISSLFGAFRGYTSSYASYHQGHDIANTNGTPIYAANDGIVRISRDLFVRGKCVVIDHGEGVFSTYFHMSKRAAEENTFVKKGELIGYIGSTGLSTGPHLHWEMRAGNITFDPLTILERSSIFDINLFREIR